MAAQEADAVAGAAELEEWSRENSIPFAVGMVQGDEEQAQIQWGLKSLPWLILANQRHVVTAEGFALAEFEDQLATIGVNP